MANELDEMTDPVNQAGRNINVIEKQILVRVGFGSRLFEVLLWVPLAIPAILLVARPDLLPWYGWLILSGACLLPGLWFILAKISARNYFRQLQQKIQAEASQIDNYLEQRVQILQNVAPLVSRAIELDKDVMKNIAAYRSGLGGGANSDTARNVVSQNLDTAFGRLFPQVENYPELRAHEQIKLAMQQNNVLQREITAARSLYNDTVLQWNTDLFVWPVKQIVAANARYTTRIPYTASDTVKQRAGETFFDA